MTALGLHLTKCAGTSLISTLRRCLTEDEYLFLSSFYENEVSHRPYVWDLQDLSQKRLVFGHYLHEALITLLQPADCWSFYLFTGVRDPLDRAYSQYRHLQRIQSLDPALDEFVELYGSSMCDEILRAFPSLVDPDRPKWLNAATILTCFDYIYSTESYDQTIRAVISHLQIPLQLFDLCSFRDNLNPLPDNPELYDRLKGCLLDSDDHLLYSVVKPAIGVENAGRVIADYLGSDRQREELYAIAVGSPCDNARALLFRLYSDLFGYELHLLGQQKKDNVLQRLERRASYLQDLIGFLGDRVY